MNCTYPAGIRQIDTNWGRWGGVAGLHDYGYDLAIDTGDVCFLVFVKYGGVVFEPLGSLTDGGDS